ncbi:MAG: alanine:cation symporter family protein [Chromatocurvus sp.]
MGYSGAGGVVGTTIIIGARRGAFSNEAGIGAESLAHGADQSRLPYPSRGPVRRVRLVR